VCICLSLCGFQQPKQARVLASDSADAAAVNVSASDDTKCRDVPSSNTENDSHVCVL